MRSVNAMIFGCAALLSVVMLTGCSHEDVQAEQQELQHSDDAAAILKVLQEDYRINQGLDLDPETPVVEFVGYVVGQMISINLRNCPADFQDAYEEHTRAWQKELKLVRSYAKEVPSLQKYWEIGLTRGMAADSSLEEEFHLSFEEIAETYESCQRIAEMYGVSDSEYTD